MVSLHLEMQLAITSTSGTEKSRQLPPIPVLYCTAATSVLPLPVGPESSTSCTLCPMLLVLNHTRFNGFFFLLAYTFILVTMRPHSHYSSCTAEFIVVVFEQPNQNQSKASSQYNHSPVVPAGPFIHNSMVTYGISRM